MPIDLITGQPGNGKTLRMMELLLAEAAKPQDKRRFLVNMGIEGLASGICDLDLPDGKLWNLVDFDKAGTCACHDGIGQVLDKEGLARKIGHGSQSRDNPQWQIELDAGRPHAHVIPDGALICVDEAWKSFGHLQDASRAATPQHVLALAEHRHRGLDFIWTTQMSNQIFPFVRGLIGSHTHVARRFGTRFCTLFTWGELCDDTKSQTQRDKSLQKSWVLPTKTAGAKYKSTVQNTIKARLPWKLLLIPICLVGAIVMGWYSYQSLKPDNFAAKLNGKEAAATGVAGAAPASGNRQEMPRTAAQWKTYLTPTIPGMAFTAPVFAENLEVTTHPRTICYLVGLPGADVCKCVTEQATKLELSEASCRTNVADAGGYDPFKVDPADERKNERRQEPQTLTDAQAQEVATARVADGGA